MLRISNLYHSYGIKPVLKDINLELPGGQISGIVGENGAGKTTLFKCIAGLENYDGEVESDHKILKNHIGFLQTNPIIMSRITGWEYLKLFCVARNIKKENFELRNIFELPLNQYADTYSTGMKKKLALMAILMQENDIYILDEPFNGVDIHSNIIISQIIQELKALNKTVLISSHIFTTLSDNCDKIHLLKNACIAKSVERANFDQLEHEMKKFALGDRIERLQIK